jgi:hypothetical protein
MAASDFTLRVPQKDAPDPTARRDSRECRRDSATAKYVSICANIKKYAQND